MKDALWSQLPNLLPLPFDEMSVEAFVRQPGRVLSDNMTEAMTMAFRDN
jgi:hypothetical protein